MPPDPTRRATLLALAARAEAGEQDTGLSNDIWVAIGWQRPNMLEAPNNRAWHGPHGGWHPGPRPDLTRSIDAQEAVGPRIIMSRWFEARTGCWRAEAQCGDYFETSDAAPTEPLARLAAKLRALAAQEDGDG